jgi:hypothetical protein
MRSYIPPALVEQTNEYLKQCPTGSIAIRTTIADRDNLRIFYRRPDGVVESKLFPWIKGNTSSLALPASKENDNIFNVNDMNSESFEIIR